MDNKNTHFPQYRKLKNGLRYYKINSAIEFEEIQWMGDKVFHFKFIAEQYPEKLRILDMLEEESAHYDTLSADTWDKKRSEI